jgi:hypothetical protein
VRASVEGDPDLARLAAARRSALADRIGHVADPGVLVVGVLLVVAMRSAGSVWAGLGWAALAAVFCVGVPYAVLHVLVRRGAATDRHVVVRHERRTPLAAALVSVAVGVRLLLATGAPAPVTALVVAMLAGLAAMAVVSLVHKASFHVAVATGAAVVLALAVGLVWGLLLLPGVALVGWARVRAGRHTRIQTLVGAVIGGVAAACVYPPLAG